MNISNMQSRTILTSVFVSLGVLLVSSCGAGKTGGGLNVGGTASGLIAGNSVVLDRVESIGGPPVDTITISQNGTYRFSKQLAKNSGQSAYLVRVATQPGNQFCSASNSAGPVTGADITNINVKCWNKFMAAANMLTPRHSHTATLLGNGKVLVVGGQATFSLTAALSSAELYDPVANTWTTAAPMVTARVGHTANFLVGGNKVLVVGGSVGTFGATNSAELYDPANNTWAAAAPMVTARIGHVSVVLADGKVLVAGGGLVPQGTSNEKSAEIYDPGTNTWSSAGNLSLGTNMTSIAQTATLLANGKVLVAEGESPTVLGKGVAEIYDPTSKTWTATSLSATFLTIGKNSGFLLADGNVLLTGSSNAMIYNVAANSWQSTVVAGSFDLNTLFLNQASELGSALLISPHTVMVTNAQYPNSSFFYDSTDNTWSQGPSLAVNRVAYTATLLSNGRVLIAGGTSRSTTNPTYPYDAVLNSAELY